MRGLESIELVIAMSIFLVFILGFMYLFDWFGLYKQQETLQVDLSAVAQQVLDRIINNRPYNPSKSLGLGGDGKFIDDYLVYYYAMATNAPGNLKLCKIESKALSEYLGVSEAFLAGRGWLILKLKDATLNYSSILTNLFGTIIQWGGDTRPPSRLYDIRLVVEPMATANCAIIGSRAMLKIVSNGKSVDGRVVYSVYYVPSGTKKLCYSSGIRPTQNGILELDLRLHRFLCEDGSEESYGEGTAVVIFEKIDRPTLFCYNSTNQNRPFIYGFAALRGESLSLYVVHDHAISCGGGDLSTLGVRYVELFWGGTRVRVAEDVTLDPGVGQGALKVDRCGECTGNARCTACYIDNVPRGTKIAVVVVETSAAPQAGGGLDIIVVPLMPYPPFKSVDIATWSRWGLSTEPKVYTTVATRVLESYSTTYNVTLWVYRWP